MTAQPFLPHIDQLLRGLQVTRARLNSRTKIAIDTAVLRALLHSLVRTLSFDAAFYRAHNLDVDAAFRAGQITDLHEHFIETGYFEGRFATAPPVDEAFYIATYPDIGVAIAHGDIASAAEHYARSGAAEGRVPCAALQPEINRWASVLGA